MQIKHDKFSYILQLVSFWDTAHVIQTVSALSYGIGKVWMGLTDNWQIA